MKATVLLVASALPYHPAPGENYDEKKMFGELDASLTLAWGVNCYDATNDGTYIEEAPFLALAHLKAAGFDDGFIQKFWVKLMPKFRDKSFRKTEVTLQACVNYFGHMRGLHPGYMELTLPE